MTQPDLSSLALPDSPELPAEIEQAIKALARKRYAEGSESSAMWTRPVWNDRPYEKMQLASDAALAELRSVIAKHLLTAEEAAEVLDHLEYAEARGGWGATNAITEKLKLNAGRRLSGSSRGEE